MVLLHIKVTTKVEQCHLTYLTLDTFAANEAVGEIRFASGEIAGSGATDKHPRENTGKQSIRRSQTKLLWHYKSILKFDSNENNSLLMQMPRKHRDGVKDGQSDAHFGRIRIPGAEYSEIPLRQTE